MSTWYVPSDAEDVRSRFDVYRILSRLHGETSITISNSHNQTVVRLGHHGEQASYVEMGESYEREHRFEPDVESKFFTWDRDAGCDQTVRLRCHPSIPLYTVGNRYYDPLDRGVAVFNAHLVVTMGLLGPSVQRVTLAGVGTDRDGKPTILCRDVEATDEIRSYVSSMVTSAAYTALRTPA